MKRNFSSLGHVFVGVALLCLAACGGSDEESGTFTPTPTPAAPTATCSVEGVNAAYASPYPTVCMLTTQGEMVIELYPLEAPITVANFLKYVSAGLYSGTLYHRVVRNFVTQGGGYTADMQPIATYPPIELESDNGLSNVRGTVGMARTNVPDSATSQFFVNVVDNSGCLNYGTTIPTCDANGYAVFGRVIFGLSVVDQINAVAVDPAGQPLQDVVTYWAHRVR